MQQLASDNQAGICPEALAALLAANSEGHVPSYGDDRWTAELKARIRTVLEAPRAEAFLVFNGTSAHALTLAQL
ncbi:MAG: beta-eliminating lyase-related protein, partial [Hyphomicrobiaceae bacterium]